VKQLGLILFLTAFGPLASGATLELSGNTDPICVQNPAAGVYCAANNTFEFIVSSAGGGFFQIINAETAAITELNINVPYVDASCSTSSTPGNNVPTLLIEGSFLQQFASGSVSVNSLATCDKTVSGQADYALFLNFLPGIPVGVQFNINLNDDGSTNVAGGGGWVPNATTVDHDNAVPEPGTLAGAAGGIAFVMLSAYRHRRVAASLLS
jgi:hypothetical protein